MVNISRGITFGSESEFFVGELSTTIPFQYHLALVLLDSELDRAPTAVLAQTSEANPDEEVRYYIDGVLVATTVADSQGDVGIIALNIAGAVGTTVGTHTVQVRQTGSVTASATYTLARVPQVTPGILAPDTQAVEIPGAVTSNGTRRWVWQDLMPDGLGSWIMPMNPSEMSAPYLQVNTSNLHTTTAGSLTSYTDDSLANDGGQFHIFEGSPVPTPWTFKGFCPTKEQQKMMLTYKNLNRRFYIIDHRNRAWKVAIQSVAFTTNLRKIYNGQPTDWGADYEVSAIILDQSPVIPA